MKLGIDGFSYADLQNYDRLNDLAGAFDRFGMRPEESQNIEKAAADFDSKVQEIRKRDNCTQTEAMQKARTEHPDLFAKMQGEEVEAQTLVLCIVIRAGVRR